MLTKSLRLLYEFLGRARNKNLSGGQFPHSTFIPVASYSPWINNPEFNEIYEQIKHFTLVHRTKCYILYELVQETNKLQGDLLEVGVWRGGTGALIAAKACKGRSGDKVYLCDTFQGVVKASNLDKHYVGREHADTSLDTVEGLLKKLKLNNVIILKGIFPDETGYSIINNFFRFCHIDVDVYLSAKDIVDWLWPKMVVGGVIVFDDYGFQRTNGITRYVEEQRAFSDRIVMYNLSGQGIMIKIR